MDSLKRRWETLASARTALLAGLVLVAVLPGEGAEARSCHTLPGFEERCETWSIFTEFGENCCDPGWVRGFNGSRHFLESEGQLFLTLPVNEPGLPGLEERWDWETSSFSASDGRLLWRQRWKGQAWDIPLSLAVDPDENRTYVTGYRDYPESPNQVSLGGCTQEFQNGSAMTIAYDSLTGQELWRSGFEELPFLDAAFNSVLSPDGEILYQAGVRLGGNPAVCDFDAAVAALDAETGRHLWGRVVAVGTATTFPFDAAYGITTTLEGDRLIVSGTVDTAGAGKDFFTKALEVPTDSESPAESGAIAWQALYDGGINLDDEMTAMSFDVQRDRVYVTGWSSEGTNLACSLVFITGCQERQYSTVAYDASSGSELWRRKYLSPAVNHPYDIPHALAVSPDGSKVFVTGESVGTHDVDSDYATVAYDAATGAELWDARYGLPTVSLEWAHDVLVSEDGSRVYVTGESWRQIGETTVLGGRAATVAYESASGDEVWVGRFDDPAGRPAETFGEQMAFSPDASQLFVTGWGVDHDATGSRDEDWFGLVFSYALPETD